MRKLSIWHWLLASWLVLGVFLWQQFLCDCWFNAPNIATQAVIGAWRIKDADNFSATSNEHLKFIHSSATYLDPFPINLNEVLIKTANYLKDNPNKLLIINGFYRADESNTSLLPNLGIARASDVKNLMIRLGIPAERIKINATQITENELWFKNDTLQKGIDFTFDSLENIR